MSTQYTVAVVGGGAMGSAAAWQLAHRGHDVTVFDRFRRGHHHGSSHGAARIFRLAYPTVEWTNYARESLDLWRELQESSGEELLSHVGGIDHGDPSAIDELTESLRLAEVPHERLSPEQASSRWPGMQFDRAVLFHPAAGRLDAEATVACLLARAEELGAEVLEDNAVRHIEQFDDHAIIHPDEGAARRVDRVVVTAGAWAPSLLGQLLDEPPPMTVTMEQPAFFTPRVEAAWPTFLHYADGTPKVAALSDPVCSYGLPNPDGRVKIGEHHTGQVVDPDNRPATHDPERLDRLRSYVGQWFPGLDVSTAEAETCLYTTTPATDFVLDRVGSVVVGAGFSGHGFKFVPWIGQQLARLVEGHRTAPRFHLSR